MMARQQAVANVTFLSFFGATATAVMGHQACANFFGKDSSFWLLRELQHGHPVHETNRGGAVNILPHHHIARQKQPDIRIGS